MCVQVLPVVEVVHDVPWYDVGADVPLRPRDAGSVRPRRGRARRDGAVEEMWISPSAQDASR